MKKIMAIDYNWILPSSAPKPIIFACNSKRLIPITTKLKLDLVQTPSHDE